MSLAPLPIRWFFLIAGLKGLIVQSFIFPGGTTSKWPANIKFGWELPNLAYRFLTGLEFLSLNSKILHLNPIAVNFLAKNFITPASTGVMLGNLISSLANVISL